VRRCRAEPIAVDDALDRVLGADVVAERQLPAWDNSAMDGFAVRSADVPATLPVAGTVAAGVWPAPPLAPGTALRVMTGAPMPAGADAVVIREVVDDCGDRARFAEPARPGQNLRRAGEDVAIGQRVLAAGCTLSAGEIGLLAALGQTHVEVAGRPRVALLSTGDELVELGREPGPGQIINSNAHALAAQVREAGGVPIALGIARDDRADLPAQLRRGWTADILCTSGGVSVGDYDYVRDAFAELGVGLEFWKVAMKPGKPLAFGVAGGGPLIFGLPGNPVSSMVSFELFVRPVIRLLQGAADVDRPQIEVVLQSEYRKAAGRAHYVRARLDVSGPEYRATIVARQGSAMLHSMVGIDALVEIPAAAEVVAAGSRVWARFLRRP
jgi:molybdopterin molybdotransferase